MQSLKELIRPFYTNCLTVNSKTDVKVVLEKLLSDDFHSVNAAGTKDKATLIGQFGGFWKMMPDMVWEIQDMIQEGNKVVVRSLFSGSPQGNFMGVEVDGSRKFKTMAIDIHIVEDGQIKEIYHCEEWLTAIAQIKG